MSILLTRQYNQNLKKQHTLPNRSSQHKMDNLTEQQYQSVLQYMQDAHEESFQQAYKIMSQNNFDLGLLRERRRQSQRQAQQGEYREINEEEEDQEIFKMRKFLLRKAHNRRRNNKLLKCGTCIRNLCVKFTQKFIPELIKRKVIRSPFYQLYQDEAVIELLNGSLAEALAEARRNKRRLFVIVSGRERNEVLVEFLKKKKLLLKIMEDYEILGIVDGEFREQHKQLYPQSPTQKSNNSSMTNNTSAISLNKSTTNLNKSQPPSLSNIDSPCILILRERHTEDIEIVQHYKGERQILQIKEETLVKVQQKIQANLNKQSALLRRITERLFEESYNALQIEGNVANIRGMRGNQANHQQQQQRNNDVQQFVANRQQSRLIAQQNRQYLAMAEKIKQTEQKQQKKQQELQQYIQERQCRKLSLPEQPSQNSNVQQIVRIVFRCPNGDSVYRKFDKNEKCQILFMWVELNDEIEFEGDEFVEMGTSMIEKQDEKKGTRKGSGERVLAKDRKFDLLFSYPPESLREKVNMRLGDVFEGEEQIKVLIRQL